MRTTTWLAVAALACAAIGCSSDEGDDTAGDDTVGDDSGGDDVPPGVLDVRVPIPEPDPNFIDLITGEEIVEAGEEAWWCYYLSPGAEELTLTGMQVFQGQYGHHVTVLSTDDPMPDGTAVECSDPAYMTHLNAYVLPIDPLPDGVGVKIPGGQQVVLQMHYVNAGDQPILVRDVARLHKIDPATVTTWAAAMAFNDINVDLPPGESASEFDCVLAEDADLMVIGGHMHESGIRYSVEVGPDVASLENIYLVDPWKPQYRDAPPITMFFTAPMHLPAGTIVRTTCTWMNAGTEPIPFPEEMCTTFGYLGGRELPLRCDAN